ncbi:hypothetical protein Tco_0829980 [Tanacetum coccineum]
MVDNTTQPGTEDRGCGLLYVDGRPQLHIILFLQESSTPLQVILTELQQRTKGYASPLNSRSDTESGKTGAPNL